MKLVSSSFIPKDEKNSVNSLCNFSSKVENSGPMYS